MNTTDLKNYAPQARQDFIAAVTARAAIIGLTAKQVEPITEQGDVALIGDKAFPRAVAVKRKKLEDCIQQQGFDQVMEAMAYTWFNRFMAIRYMELHGYLDHGRRVLSHPEKKNGFEILDDCAEIDLPGVDRDQVVELKLAGNKDEELYRILLLGQCHALHEAMPFLFEAIDDETELLLPDNLTKTDSLIGHLVDDIPDDNWKDIEIIGWLYQFYISEKKDQVIGKVVKSEDIPAATQLFTPNWIVKYMVQNSLGAQWLATYPDSTLKGQMEYFIEPAEQTEEVNQQLKAITPTSLNPEELTLIDPASGSGHILVEAYELFKAIYLERGYRQRDIPQLILEKNIFGLDIDERAAQLTGFALMMKGRADDRRLFERGVKLSVMVLVDSAGFDAEGLAKGVQLSDYGLKAGDLTELKRLFEHATTFGSLIQVPEGLASSLPSLKQLSEVTSQDLFVAEALKRLEPQVQQAELLAAQYDAVVANPPYMGSKNMSAPIKKFVKDHFPDASSDLFACFIERSRMLITQQGQIGMVAPFVWMFLSSYERFRSNTIYRSNLSSLIQLEYNAFEPACIPVAAFTLAGRHVSNYRGTYIKLSNFKGHETQAPRTREAIENPKCGWSYISTPDNFQVIPGGPVAFWVPDRTLDSFVEFPRIDSVAKAKQGLITGDNDRFLRLWQEVSAGNSELNCMSRADSIASEVTWFPFQKGGSYRKWYGNHQYLVDWRNDGHAIRNFIDDSGKLRSRPQSMDYYFKAGITWTSVTIAAFNCRLSPTGFIYSEPGPVLHATDPAVLSVLAGFLNSNSANFLLQLVAPAMHYNQGHISDLPLLGLSAADSAQLEAVVSRQTRTTKDDWNAYERSWDFQSLPLLTTSTNPMSTLESSYTAWITQNCDTIAEMKRLEEENNRLFIDAYGLQDELTPDVPIEQITLTVNPCYRYGGKLTEEEQWIRFRQDSLEELVSYAIGCMMGRYSLDAPGLIYAHSGNEGFDPSRYPTFPTDEDGIVPLTDTEWFDDDACNRFIEFISKAWDEIHLEANLTFSADNLSPKKNESSRETIRRYLCDKFFKDHLQSYKKRPIYWLFSSGKQRAFQCLVYLHRYNEGTLARMRTEYVIPLQGKMSSRIEQLDSDIMAASSTAHRKKLERERDKLAKQRIELQEFDEKLRHYADQRIHLNLDDGVKVNYGKFGDLLAQVKAVTGEKP